MILMMVSIEEVDKVLKIKGQKPTIHSTVLEDNNEDLDLVNTTKMIPRTNHITEMR